MDVDKQAAGAHSAERRDPHPPRTPSELTRSHSESIRHADLEKQAADAHAHGAEPSDARGPRSSSEHTRAHSTVLAGKAEADTGERIVTWHTRADGPPAASKEGADAGALDPLTDPENPQGWSKAQKIVVLLVASSCQMCVTCCSSIVTSCYENIERELGASQEVAILGLSIFVAGLGLGPILIAPLSEFYGRRPIFLVSFAAYTLLGLPVAFANNLPVFFIFRFLTGLAGSSFLSVAGGTVTDLYQAREVFIPMAIFSAAPFAGPELGPIYSGFANYFSGTFRWSFYAMTIWSALQWVAVYFFMPETFAPMILTKRARALRAQTGDERWRSELERRTAGRSVGGTIAASAMRVPQLLALEPMLLLLCVWSALLLGIVYLLFESYPIIFVEGHGFNLWQVGLTFLGIFVGMMSALLSMPFWNQLYLDAAEAAGGSAPPEARLPPAMLGAFLTVIGMFLYAFTSYPHVHWIGPTLAGVPFGAGLLLIFIAIFTFTGDAYRPVAASAMACNSVMRSSFAAGFPLFSTQMYRALGTVGASCLLAGLNVLMIPVPFVFYKYGAAIRAKSKFTLG